MHGDENAGALTEERRPSTAAGAIVELVQARVTRSKAVAMAVDPETTITTMPRTLPVLSLCVLMAPLFAQVSVSVAAASPITASVTVGATVDLRVQPAGPLTPSGSLQPAVGSDALSTVWEIVATGNGSSRAFMFGHYAASSSTGAQVAGAGDVVFTVTALDSVSARLHLDGGTTGTAGLPTGAWSVDIGDDGSIEASNLNLSLTQLSLILSPQPLAVRVRAACSFTGPGQLTTAVGLRLEPEGLQILPVLPRCQAGWLDVQPTFVGSGVQINGSVPIVVLGLAPQTFVLPGAPGCLLLPRPDAVWLFATSSQVLPIPLSVRPLTVWVQGVDLTAAGLGTSTAFVVQAN